MKKIILVACCCCVAGFVQAQSLSSSVIGSAGENFNATIGSLEWTLGEIMTETYKESMGYLTQGFHQPATIKITGLEDPEEKNVFVYPNPAREVLYVKTIENGDYQFELFDLQGQKLISKNTSSIGTQIHTMEIHQFRAAIYLLRIANITNGTTAYHKIEKL